MFWFFALVGVVLVGWLSMKSQQGRSQALEALSDRKAEARAALLVAEVRREAEEQRQRDESQ